MRGEERRRQAITSTISVCFVIALAAVSAETPAAEKAPAKPAARQLEWLACRLGTEEVHARIAVEVLNGRVHRFAYYSKWKPRTCSLEIERGDAFSKWLDEGSTTAILLREEMGSFWIDHGHGRFHFTFSNVDRVRYCGMDGKINGYLTIWRGRRECALQGVMDEADGSESAVTTGIGGPPAAVSAVRDAAISVRDSPPLP